MISLQEANFPEQLTTLVGQVREEVDIVTIIIGVASGTMQPCPEDSCPEQLYWLREVSLSNVGSTEYFTIVYQVTNIVFSLVSWFYRELICNRLDCFGFIAAHLSQKLLVFINLQFQGNLSRFACEIRCWCGQSGPALFRGCGTLVKPYLEAATNRLGRLNISTPSLTLEGRCANICTIDQAGTLKMPYFLLAIFVQN